jgi:hypothetical protein
VLINNKIIVIVSSKVSLSSLDFGQAFLAFPRQESPSHVGKKEWDWELEGKGKEKSQMILRQSRDVQERLTIDYRRDDTAWRRQKNSNQIYGSTNKLA